MEFLTAFAGLLAGVIIGGMIYRLWGLKSLQQYAAGLLMDTNEQQRLRLQTMEREAQERNDQILALKEQILELETRLKQVEKIQNGH